MAPGTAGNFVVYNEEFFGGYVEELQQNAEVFNASSNGALVLRTEGLKGDYNAEAFIDLIGNLVTRRDTASVAAATDLPVTMDEEKGVKVNRKIGPVAQTLDAWRKVGSDWSTMSLRLGRQIAKAVMLDMVNTSITAITGAIKNVATLNYDATGQSTPTLTHTHLVSGMAKLGDQASRLVCWVMHSKPYFDLMKQQLADKLFEVAGATVYAGTVASFGKPVVVTDATALWDLNGSATDTYNVLGLTSGAGECIESETRDLESQLVTGLENLVGRIQGEYAFNVQLKGFEWDVANGGANPNDATIGTGTNWDQVFADVKSLGGFCVKVQ